MNGHGRLDDGKGNVVEGYILIYFTFKLSLQFIPFNYILND
jgi:hypothetical protein